MGLFRLLTAGAIGYVAYRAWQRRQPGAATPSTGDADGAHAMDADHGSRTPPHGDPVLAGADLEAGIAPRTPAQASRGFGAA